jgi:GSCFA family
VFTLGLTEAWRSTADGAAYPALPGRGFGRFDASAYAFENLGVAANVDALGRFITALREINPGVNVILTVSPVPLVATATGAHVLAATTYSKSVLRVAAEDIARAFERVAYFASLEIVMATFNQAAYFESDRRSIAGPGVDHVMRSFFRHFTSPTGVNAGESEAQSVPAPRRFSILGPARALNVSALKDPCDEDVLGAYIAREFLEEQKA